MAGGSGKGALDGTRGIKYFLGTLDVPEGFSPRHHSQDLSWRESVNSSYQENRTGESDH